MVTIQPVKLSPQIAQMLSERLNDEQKASYFYNAASNWCAVKGYEGGKKYFKGEAMEEQEHFQELANYITGMNIDPVLLPINMPERFESLVDIIEKAYEIENSLLEKYNQVSKEAFNIDFTTFEYLKKFRDIQRESVIRYSDLINQLEILNDSNKLDLFYFDQTVLAKL
jgi:ferritin